MTAACALGLRPMRDGNTGNERIFLVESLAHLSQELHASLDSMARPARWKKVGERVRTHQMPPPERTQPDPKNVLLSRKEEFTRAFVQHMLAYAPGRKLVYYGAKTVREISAQVARDEYRFLRVVMEIAKSYPFWNRRVKEQQ